MKVMLDVGSRNGESLEEFVRWPFDIIHSFEPMPAQYANIQAAFGTEPRMHLHNFGLSNVTGTLPVYGADDHGEASVFATKVDLNPAQVTQCEFVAASTFFSEHIDFTDLVLMKLNCEGSEVAILGDLLDSGQLWKVDAFRVEFDISRVVGHEGEADGILARLADAGYTAITIGSDARLVDGVLVERFPQEGTHHERLHAWLDGVFPK